MIAAFWTAISSAATSAATALGTIFGAGFGLIYDGTVLTELGEVLVLIASLGFILGVVYLVINKLPGAR